MPKGKWDPDSSASACKSCGKPFNFTRRRHHCRNCGKVMCDDCTNKRWDMHGKFWGQRVCAPCRYELRVKHDLTASRKGDTPIMPRLTLEEAKEQMSIRDDRIMELEEVVRSVSFATEQATRQRDMLLRKIAKMRGKVQRLLEASHHEAKRAGPHECDTETTIAFESGPMGLALTNAPEGYEYCMEIEGFTKLSDGITGPAELFNQRRIAEGACCGLLRKGMLLVTINGRTVAGLTYTAVETALRNASRPVTLKFRDIQFSQLRRQYNELQTRFSILSVQADLNRGTLRDTAEAALSRVDSANRLIAMLARRFKLTRRQLAQITKTHNDSKGQLAQLYQQRRDLEARLAFATGGMAMSGATMMSNRAEAAAKAKDAEILICRKTIREKEEALEHLNKERSADQARIAKLQRQLSQQAEQTDAMLKTIQEFEAKAKARKDSAGAGRGAGAGTRGRGGDGDSSDSDADDALEALRSRRLRSKLDAGGLWELYRTEQQRRTFVEDENDDLRDRVNKLEGDLDAVKAALVEAQTASGGGDRRRTRSRSRSSMPTASHRLQRARSQRGVGAGSSVMRHMLGAHRRGGIELFQHLVKEVEGVTLAVHGEATPGDDESSSSSDDSSDSDSDDEELHFRAVAERMAREVEVKDRRYRLKLFKQCFIGSEAVLWLVSSGLADTPDGAIKLGNNLMRRGYFAHVTMEHVFENKPLFYRFTDKKAPVPVSDGSASESDDGGSDSESTPKQKPHSSVYDGASLAVATAALVPGGKPAMSAYLQKASKEAGKSMTGWKKRWVMIGGGQLAYFGAETDMNPKGECALKDIIRITPLTIQAIKKQFAFEVDVPGKTYYFQATSNKERESWLTALGACKFRAKELEREKEAASRAEARKARTGGDDASSSSSSSSDDDDSGSLSSDSSDDDSDAD